MGEPHGEARGQSKQRQTYDETCNSTNADGRCENVPILTSKGM